MSPQTDQDALAACDNFGIGHWQWDIRTNKIVYSNRWRKIRGSSFGETGSIEDSMRAVHRDHRDQLTNSREQLIQGLLEVYSIDYRIKTADGSWLWVEERANAVKDAEGNIVGIQACEIDISKRKQEELFRADQTKQTFDQTLYELTEQLPETLGTGSIGLWEWSFIDKQLSWDKRMFDIHGTDRADFKGNIDDWKDLLHPDDIEHAFDPANQQLEKGKLALEFRILRPDGEIRNIHSSCYLATDDEGNRTSLVGITIDITESRNAEVALIEAQQQITRMANNVPGMIYRHMFPLDAENNGKFISTQCQQMFGVNQQDAIEDLTTLFNWIHPEDMELLIARVKESVSELKTLFFEYRVNHPDKGLRWYRTQGHPEALDNGKVALDGFVLDITDEKQAELSMQRANDELAVATQLKDEFLATLSHELRTPLNAVLGMVEGLADGIYGPLNDKQIASLDVIQRSGSHLVEMINEVLDLAKLESSKVEVQLSRVNVIDLCQTCMQQVAMQAEKKQIDLRLNLPLNLPEYEVDERRLRQIIINLLGNSVKFTPNGGQVTLEVQQCDSESPEQNKTLRLSVCDNGIGIPSNDLNRLFEPFVQIDNSLSQQNEGTGLGLYLVKRFVELLNGSIGVTSLPGSGCCFTVELPLHPATVGTCIPTDKSDSVIRQNTEVHSDERKEMPFVLYAEDNDMLAQTTVCYLREFNFKVQLVTDGELAINAARDQTPDIILMDVQMPKIDGLEAIRQIRQMSHLAETPIIALTGMAMENDADRCLSAGATDYLSKPYKVKQLVELIRHELAAEMTL